MNAIRRAEVLKTLEQAAKQVVQAQALLEGEESIVALHALANARQMNRRAVVALMVACLETLLDEAAAGPTFSQERLDELTVLLRFAWSALCPACRQLLGDRLKKTMPAPRQRSKKLRTVARDGSAIVNQE